MTQRLSRPTALPWRDTPRAYGVISRVLHWAVAGLLLWQFLGMGLRLILGRHPVVGVFVGSHQSVGTLLFVLIVARVVWTGLNRRNRPDHGAGLRGLAARLGHQALYAAMTLVPAVAILRAWGNERAFAPFGVEIFAPREGAVDWAVTLGDALHGELGWVLLVLIAGHVAMVGLHETMWRDGTLARMAGGRRARTADRHG